MWKLKKKSADTKVKIGVVYGCVSAFSCVLCIFSMIPTSVLPLECFYADGILTLTYALTPVMFSYQLFKTRSQVLKCDFTPSPPEAVGGEKSRSSKIAGAVLYANLLKHKHYMHRHYGTCFCHSVALLHHYNICSLIILFNFSNH